MRDQRSSRGAVAVEFALIAPVLLLVVFGMVEFGRLAFVQISLNSASHELARAYALGPISSATETAILSATANSAARVANVKHASPSLVPKVCASAGATCTPVTRPTSALWTPCTAGSYSIDVKVNVSVTFDWFTPLFGGSLPLNAQGVMLCA